MRRPSHAVVVSYAALVFALAGAAVAALTAAGRIGQHGGDTSSVTVAAASEPVAQATPSAVPDEPTPAPTLTLPSPLNADLLDGMPADAFQPRLYAGSCQAGSFVTGRDGVGRLTCAAPAPAPRQQTGPTLYGAYVLGRYGCPYGTSGWQSVQIGASSYTLCEVN